MDVLAEVVLWGEECSMNGGLCLMPGRRIGARQFGGGPLKLQRNERRGLCLHISARDSFAGRAEPVAGWVMSTYW